MKTCIYGIMAIALFVASGCKTALETALGSYTVCYPARSDVGPGQVWSVRDEVLENQIAQKPDTISITSGDGQLMTIKEHAYTLANAKTVLKLLSTDVDLFTNALTAMRVTDIEVTGGSATISRLRQTSEFRNPAILEGFESIYLFALKDSKRLKRSPAVISEVLISNNLQYRVTRATEFTVDEKAKLKLVQASGFAQAGEKNEIVWSIPPGKNLVIGYKRLSEDEIGDPDTNSKAFLLKRDREAWSRQLVAMIPNQTLLASEGAFTDRIALHWSPISEPQFAKMTAIQIVAHIAQTSQTDTAIWAWTWEKQYNDTPPFNLEIDDATWAGGEYRKQREELGLSALPRDRQLSFTIRYYYMDKDNPDTPGKTRKSYGDGRAAVGWARRE